ncbi:MAG: DUF5312 family protein [Spirochaetia bacterium]|jgi:hypothetical protein
MPEKSRLEELSKELPDKERKELLERIGKRMEREDGEEAVPVELQDDERQKIIAFEMKKAGAWIRFLMWLRTFFSGKSRSEVFLDIRLRFLKMHIRSVSPGITGFETRDLSAKFGRKLYDVFIAAQPVLGIYHALASDKAVRGAAYAWYVEQKLEHAKKTIDDFVGTAEMEEIFAQTGQTEEIRKKLSLRLNDYVRTIPESFMLQLEEQARLHLSLGRLASFSFASFFRYFNCVLGDTIDPKYPPFEHAPVMLTLDLMEKLHAAFGLFHRSAPDYLYAEEPVAYYLYLRAGLKPGAEDGGERIGTELGQLRADVLALAKEIDAFEAAIPLLDLLRYFRKDPWFQLMLNPPRLYLKNLYFTTLKTRLGVELEERLGTIKERVIDRKIQDLLKGQRMMDFSYYRENPDFDFRKLGLPYFSSIRSLTLVYNYLQMQFKGAMQEASQIVSSTALANNRILQSRLAQNISGLEDLEARIVLFDRSLSPDEEDGKQMGRFRFSVATDLLLQKTYRSFLLQKDRDAHDLIDKTREFLTAVRKIFDDIRTSTFENTRSLLKTIHLYRGRNQTLGQILNARSEAISAFLKLLDQLLEIEKGF